MWKYSILVSTNWIVCVWWLDFIVSITKEAQHTNRPKFKQQAEHWCWNVRSACHSHLSLSSCFCLSLLFCTQYFIWSSESAAYHQVRSMKSLLEIRATSPIRMYHFALWQVLNKIVKFREANRKCSESKAFQKWHNQNEFKT